MVVTSEDIYTSKENVHHLSKNFDVEKGQDRFIKSNTCEGDTKKVGGLFGLTGMRRRGKTDDKKPNVAPKAPARVEPKSFFANERTFIQWITVGSLFLLVAAVVSYIFIIQ